METGEGKYDGAATRLHTLIYIGYSIYMASMPRGTDAPLPACLISADDSDKWFGRHATQTRQ